MFDGRQQGGTRGDEHNEACSLVRGSVWGIVQCAALEMNSRLSLMVCIDTEALVMGGRKCEARFCG